MIHPEGYKTLIGAFFFLLLFNIIIYFTSGEPIYLWISLAGSMLLYIIILQFFRNPKRNIAISENHVIAPADGKIVVIEEVFENEYLNEKRIQVSIFMSPFNVHVNRYPISGTVHYVKYHSGKYLVAWHPKSSTENERTTIAIENSKVRILFRQIAGVLARRIVFYTKENQKVEQGDIMGFIKFGSRVDLFLPLNSKILVKPGEKTTGGITPIAEI